MEPEPVRYLSGELLYRHAQLLGSLGRTVNNLSLASYYNRDASNHRWECSFITKWVGIFPNRGPAGLNSTINEVSEPLKCARFDVNYIMALTDLYLMILRQRSRNCFMPPSEITKEDEICRLDPSIHAANGFQPGSKELDRWLEWSWREAVANYGKLNLHRKFHELYSCKLHSPSK